MPYRTGPKGSGPDLVVGADTISRCLVMDGKQCVVEDCRYGLLDLAKLLQAMKGLLISTSAMS
jgi:hypothetical protein